MLVVVRLWGPSLAYVFADLIAFGLVSAVATAGYYGYVYFEDQRRLAERGVALLETPEGTLDCDQGDVRISLPDRATIGNMSPEFGCTITYFPIDDQTLKYMATTNRSAEQIALVEDYCKANMLWHENEDLIGYSHVLELNLEDVRPTVAGPKRPQDKILLKDLDATFQKLLEEVHGRAYILPDDRLQEVEEIQIQRWKSEGGGGTHRIPERKTGDNAKKEVHFDTHERLGLKTVRIGIGNAGGDRYHRGARHDNTLRQRSDRKLGRAVHRRKGRHMLPHI